MRTPVYLTSEHRSAKAAEPKAVAESNVPWCMSGLQRFDVSRIVSQGVFDSQVLPQETIFKIKPPRGTWVAAKILPKDPKRRKLSLLRYQRATWFHITQSVLIPKKAFRIILLDMCKPEWKIQLVFIPDLDVNHEHHPNPTQQLNSFTTVIRIASLPHCSPRDMYGRYLTSCPNFPHLRLRLEPPRPCCAPDIAAGIGSVTASTHRFVISIISADRLASLSFAACRPSRD